MSGVDLFGIISLELAIGSVLVGITAFFVTNRLKLIQMGKQIEALNKNIEKGFSSILSQSKDVSETLSNLVTASASIASSMTGDHERMMDRFSSSARRADKQIEVLNGMVTQLTSLSEDRERIAEAMGHHTQRIVDKIEHAKPK